MKLIEIMKKEYQKDVEHFGKNKTIILYVQFIILCLIGFIGCILGFINDDLATIAVFVLMGWGAMLMLYLIIIYIIAKLKRTRLLLALKCIEEGENITYKYNSHIAMDDVPELLIRSSLAMLKYKQEEALKIINEVCNNPDTPVEKEEG